jgi:hypothetical protein
VLTFRLPSGADIGEAYMASFRVGRPVTQFVEHPIPGSTQRGRTAFTVDAANERITVEYVNTEGVRMKQEFAGTSEYAADYGSRTILPDAGTIKEMMIEIDRWRFERESGMQDFKESDAEPALQATGGRRNRAPRGAAPNRPPETLPERYQIPEHGLRNYTEQELLGFYRARRATYPREVRAMLDEIQPGMSNRAMRDRLNQLDRAIRDTHTAEANRLLGRANRPPEEQPFITSQRATSNEGGRISSLLTDEKNLSLTGRIPGGGVAEFDSVRFRGRVIEETKLSLYEVRRGGPRLQPLDRVRDQMMRQARFAKAWGFFEVRWSVLDYESELLAHQARADLARYHPELAGLIKVTDPTQAW